MLFKGRKRNYDLADKPLGSGGEGTVYKVNNRNDIVAKIYSTPTKEYENKLTYMSNNPPDRSVLTDIAWPLDILYDSRNQFCGFIMPMMDAKEVLHNLYKYDPNKTPILTNQKKIVIAINICRVISTVHKAGYVFGDFNPRNIGVNLSTGHIGFFDTDGYHINDKNTGKTYRCVACEKEYTAPELIKQCKGTDYANAPLPTFTQETDRFSLAIHIFKLLMNGFTPFNGIKNDENRSTASPGYGIEAIERDNYCFKPGNKPLSLAVPELSSFPREIQILFTRAFIEGRKDPKRRPTADEWDAALTEYSKNLILCSKNSNHYYYKANSKCPYCAADERYLDALYNISNKNGHTQQISWGQPINAPNPSGGNHSIHGKTQYGTPQKNINISSQPVNTVAGQQYSGSYYQGSAPIKKLSTSNQKISNSAQSSSVGYKHNGKPQTQNTPKKGISIWKVLIVLFVVLTLGLTIYSDDGYREIPAKIIESAIVAFLLTLIIGFILYISKHIIVFASNVVCSFLNVKKKQEKKRVTYSVTVIFVLVVVLFVLLKRMKMSS